MPFCTCCGNEVNEKAVACPKCGVPPKLEKNHCYHCGEKLHNPNQVLCVKCGNPITQSTDGTTPPSTLGTAKLVIRRSRNLYVGAGSRIQIHVDGQVVGQVANASCATFNLPPGKHTILFTCFGQECSEGHTYMFEEGKTISFTIKWGFTGLSILSIQHED